MENDKNRKNENKRLIQPVDEQGTERAKRGNLVHKWNEKTVSDATTGIPMDYLPDFIESLGDTLSIRPTQSAQSNSKDTKSDLFNTFRKEITTLAENCTKEGRTKTIEGKTGESSLLVMFHIAKEDDGCFSVFYAIHTIELELVNEHAIEQEDDIEAGIKNMRQYQRSQGASALASLGVESSEVTGSLTNGPVNTNNRQEEPEDQALTCQRSWWDCFNWLFQGNPGVQETKSNVSQGEISSSNGLSDTKDNKTKKEESEGQTSTHREKSQDANCM